MSKKPSSADTMSKLRTMMSEAKTRKSTSVVKSPVDTLSSKLAAPVTGVTIVYAMTEHVASRNSDRTPSDDWDVPSVTSAPAPSLDIDRARSRCSRRSISLARDRRNSAISLLSHLLGRKTSMPSRNQEHGRVEKAPAKTSVMAHTPDTAKPTRKSQMRSRGCAMPRKIDSVVSPAKGTPSISASSACVRVRRALSATASARRPRMRTHINHSITHTLRQDAKTNNQNPTPRCSLPVRTITALRHTAAPFNVMVSLKLSSTGTRLAAACRRYRITSVCRLITSPRPEHSNAATTMLSMLIRLHCTFSCSDPDNACIPMLTKEITWLPSASKC
mmetsp:Transcript_28232/g.97594  ORF Transcript_28232/g.97594 Transcript_28232/m.97594 type:complete len:332 (+) Transcript_28232:426-1421(+)